MSILTNSLFGSTGGYTHPTFEGYSFEHGGAQSLIMESYEDSLSVMEALGVLDIHLLRESADEVVVEAAVSGVIEKIKNALKKLWGKIKAFFKSIIRFFDGMVKSGADFAKKYEGDLRKLDLSSFKYKMYKYSIPEDTESAVMKSEDSILGDISSELDKIKDMASGTLEEGKKKLSAYKDSREEAEELARGILLGGGGKVDAEEFRKELFAKFRSGAEGPEDKEEIDVDIFNVMDTVKNSGKLKKAIEKAQSNTDKRYNNYLKDFDKAQKDIKMTEGKEGSGGSAAVFAGFCQEYYRRIQFEQSIVSQYYNAWIGAVKERDSTYKKVLTAAFRHKEK